MDINLEPEVNLVNVTDLAWKMLFDFPDRVCAITVSIEKEGYGFGVVDEDKAGYSPFFIYVKDEEEWTHNQWQEQVNWFNENVLGWDKDQVMYIVASSMRQGKVKK